MLPNDASTIFFGSDCTYICIYDAKNHSSFPLQKLGVKYCNCCIHVNVPFSFWSQSGWHSHIDMGMIPKSCRMGNSSRSLREALPSLMGISTYSREVEHLYYSILIESLVYAIHKFQENFSIL